jgi:hypothetical protein
MIESTADIDKVRVLLWFSHPPSTPSPLLAISVVTVYPLASA